MKTTLSIFIILTLLSTNAFGEIRTAITGIQKTDRDFVYEVKTVVFQKVILDCASFITGLTFYENNKVLYNYYLDDENCQYAFDFINNALKESSVPCFTIDEQSGLNVSIDSECK